MKRRSLAAVLAGLLACDQAVNHTVLRDGRLFGYRVAPFEPPLFIWPQVEGLERTRLAAQGDRKALARSTLDAELGWAPRPDGRFFGTEFDGLGARVSARPHGLDKGASRRILTFGGSFTMGDEVGALEAWPSLLEEAREDLEVLNFGVPGYGMDQAYLRFQRVAPELAPDEIWFGLLPAASLRVSTHFGPASNKWDKTPLFKPRFLPLDDGGLRWIPNPAPDHAETVRLLSDQRAFFDALVETDLWVARRPSAFAPRGSRFSHRFAASRLWVTALESGDRDVGPWLEDPQSEIYRTLLALLLAFERESRRLGARLRVAILPSYGDLHRRQDAGRAYWQSLVDDVDGRGIECLDLSEALVAAGALTDMDLWAPGWHYTAKGNRIVAEALGDRWLE